jgi:hypothetical protein
MKHTALIVFAICVMGLLSFSRVVAARDGSAALGSLPASAIGTVDYYGLKNDVVGQALPVPSGSSTTSNVFRDIPSISGDYSGAGTKLMPYIGAGFGSGYASDFDRSLSGRPSTQTDSGSRSHFGQGLTPSEFQFGIRIPF